MILFNWKNEAMKEGVHYQYYKEGKTIYFTRKTKERIIKPKWYQFWKSEKVKKEVDLEFEVQKIYL